MQRLLVCMDVTRTTKSPPSLNPPKLVTGKAHLPVNGENQLQPPPFGDVCPLRSSYGQNAQYCSVDSIDNDFGCVLEWPVGNVHPDRTSAIVKRCKQHKQLRAESTTMAVGGNARLLGFGVRVTL